LLLLFKIERSASRNVTGGLYKVLVISKIKQAKWNPKRAGHAEGRSKHVVS